MNRQILKINFVSCTQSIVMVVKDLVGLPLATLIANGALGSETFVKRNVEVGDLTFKGFDVRLYTQTLGFLLPEEFDGGRFGLYKGTNGTGEGEYEVYSGVQNTALFGMVKSWEGSEVVPSGWWNDGTPCSAINGTDGRCVI